MAVGALEVSAVVSDMTNVVALGAEFLMSF